MTIYSPPVSTYTALATITLSSSASSVTFSSINSGFRDLVLVVNGKTTRSGSANDLNFYVNGDTGSNYSSVYIQGDGSSASSGSFTTTFMRTTFAGTSATAVAVIQFLDYSVIDKHKSVISRGNSAAWATGAWANRWASTSAITSITLFSSVTGDLASGTTLSLFGIEA